MCVFLMLIAYILVKIETNMSDVAEALAMATVAEAPSHTTTHTHHILWPDFYDDIMRRVSYYPLHCDKLIDFYEERKL